MSTPASESTSGGPTGDVLLNAVSGMITATETLTTKAISADHSSGSGDVNSLNNLLSRDVLLAKIDISDSDIFAHPLLTGTWDPWAAYLLAPYVAQRLLGYYQIKFGMHLTFKITAPGSALGLYAIGATCETGLRPNLSGPSVGDFPIVYSCTQDEHGFINCELRNTVEMDLPWEHYKDSFIIGDCVSPSTGPLCWSVQIFTMQALTSTIGPTALGTIQIFGRMLPDYSLENISFQGKKKKVQTMPVASDNATGEKWSTFGNKVAAGISMAGSAFPVIAPFAEPVAAGLAAISSIGAMFGFTRESAPQTPTPYIPRLASSMAPIDGYDTSEVVALTVTNTLSIDPRITGGTEDDPMSFAALFDRWTLIDGFSIDPSTPINDIIGEVGVTPFWTAEEQPRVFTVGGYVGLPFEYWRGTMEYCVYIPSSTNVEGLVQILWDPNPTSPSSYPTDPTHRLLNCIISLHGSSRTEFCIDYVSNDPVKHCDVYSHACSPERAGTNGKLVFHLIAPVTSILDTTPIRILLFAKVHQDMQFTVPRTHIRVNRSDDDDYRVTFADHLILEGLMDLVETDTVGMVTTSNPDYPVEQILVGERIRSIRGLMQKFNHAFSYFVEGSEPVAEGFEIIIPHYIPPPCAGVLAEIYTNSTYLKPSFSFAGYYQVLFSSHRGSLRVKHQIQKPGLWFYAPSAGWWWTEMVKWKPNVYVPTLLTHFDAQGAYNSVDSSGGTGSNYYQYGTMHEVCFPAYSAIKSFNPRQMTLPSLTTDVNARFDYLSMAVMPFGENLSGNVFTAYGPDYNVTRFRRTPSVFISTVAPIPPVIPPP